MDFKSNLYSVSEVQGLCSSPRLSDTDAEKVGVGVNVV